MYMYVIRREKESGVRGGGGGGGTGRKGRRGVRSGGREVWDMWQFITSHELQLEIYTRTVCTHNYTCACNHSMSAK